MTQSGDEDPGLDSALTARSVQFLALLAMLAENTARLRAHTAAEQATRQERAVRELRADRLAAHGSARALYGPALDRDWSARADTLDAARVWAASGAWAQVDAEAGIAHQRAEERLRELHPVAMRRYDELRAAGRDEVEAMRAVAGLFVAAGLDTPVLDAPDRHTQAPAATSPADGAGAHDRATDRATERATDRAREGARAAPVPGAPHAPRTTVPAADRWTRSRGGR